MTTNYYFITNYFPPYFNFDYEKQIVTKSDCFKFVTFGLKITSTVQWSKLNV